MPRTSASRVTPARLSLSLKGFSQGLNHAITKCNGLWSACGNSIEPVISAFDNIEFTRHAGRSQPLGITDVFLVEEIESPDPNPGRRQTGEIFAASWHSVSTIFLCCGTVTEVGDPCGEVLRRSPQEFAAPAVTCFHCGAVIQHRVDEDLKCRRYFANVMCSLRQRGTESTSGTGTAYCDASCIDAQCRGVVVQPFQSDVAVIQRSRKRVLRGKPVLYADH